MPTLFPFVTMSLMLVSGLGSLGLPNKTLTALSVALGMMGGSPSGARLLAQLRNQSGGLSRRAAQCAAACVTTASPMFILATLTGWLGSGRDTGLIMLAAHELAAILAGLVCLSWTRRWTKTDPLPDYSTRDSSRDSINPAQAAQMKPLSLGEAIAQAASAMLAMCGCMALFNAALTVAIARITLPPRAVVIIAAALEMTGGCARIGAMNLPAATAAPMMCAAVTFGSASVFMQNAAYLSTIGVRLSIQAAARVTAGALAWALCSAMMGNPAGWIAAACVLAAAAIPAIPDKSTNVKEARPAPGQTRQARAPAAFTSDPAY